MRIATVLIVATLLGGGAIGCASAQRGLTAPRVTVQSLEPLPSSAGDQRFRVRVLIDNPNPDPLGIRELEFKLRLANEGIIDGRSQQPLTVQALDQRTLELELRSEIVSSLSRLMSFVQGPGNALPYEIYGTVTLDRRLREPLAFSARGEVPLVMQGER
jgi:LEA14-like dessication related protein